MRRAGALAALFGHALAACGNAGGGDVVTGDGVLPAITGNAAQLAAACSGCHGGPGAAFASLDGRSADELARLLATYRSQTAGTTVMHRLARGYSDAEIEAVSAYLARTGEAGR